ncbi:uncharacterized protein LOC117591704 [Drosophila guanche]|uniref:CHK kinase-like domain-containing protein n=2 Tax=Drosophila guanche TaxID=7266 RepID=A0A3B0KA08_DROGU|nr:uncharacterized protein LOC117586325 isoform X1 [Drosophila guanche]XP_034132208.1 uncharacterized protein LOC117586325 isoform X2 [Drosophila guanche]XP_034140916.1 uncharacterized protein LOC117591704 [Drosophila guanche]SPP90193.1 Hypothetical predicted protein [Drosophila guanche]
MPPQTKDEDPCTESILFPEWVKPEIFQDILKLQVKNYKETKSLRASAGVAKGENYATIMLRVELDVETEDKSQVTKAYMLKIAHDSDAYRKILEKSNIFDTERGMYLKIVPEMEKMYRDVGLEVKFGAQSYEIPTNENYVLLEDLKPQGFKNVDRLQGLDQVHTESALRKFAQWHAASAVRVDTKGPYEERYTKGFFQSPEIVDALFKGSMKSLLKYIEHYEGRETYLKDLLSISEKLDDIATKIIESNPDEFNALNHGDGWCNNIMYQYNEKNEISNTYFVDLQLPKWGSVAQDLYYFLISSTSLDIKTSKFDYFIWFYHSELVKHLQLLKYSKPLPTLRGIRNDLSNHSGWGLVCCTSVMGVVLLDPIEDDDGDFDQILSSEDSSFKKSIFTNPRYRKHAKVLLPWLQHRGAME